MIAVDVLEGIASYWLDGGWILLPIAAVSLGIWACFFRLRSGLRRAIDSGHEVEQRLDAYLGGRSTAPSLRAQFRTAPDFISGAALRTLESKPNRIEARKCFDREASSVLAFVRREVIVLRALVAAAPLLGLLGTVYGMVATFAAVSHRSVESGAMVAGGISAALITTQFGLVAALPGVFGLLHIGKLRSRLERVLSSIGVLILLAADETRAA